MPGLGHMCLRGSSTKKSIGHTDVIALKDVWGRCTIDMGVNQTSPLRQADISARRTTTARSLAPEGIGSVYAGKLHELARGGAAGHLHRWEVAVDHRDGVTVACTAQDLRGVARMRYLFRAVLQGNRQRPAAGRRSRESPEVYCTHVEELGGEDGVDVF